jgi:hypothetical protein
MDETTPIQFREEVLKKFFIHIKSGDSFFVVGAPSVGKTRLMDFLMGDDPDAIRLGARPDHQRVKSHYLGEEAASKTWLARVDMNRLHSQSDWSFHFFELLLHTLLLTCNKNESSDENDEMKERLASLDADVIQSGNALKAHRFLEMAVDYLYQSYGIKICFLFDEFDDTYRDMPRELFAQLRGIRDANKYRVFYALFLRNLPDRLRNPKENESFYELISRNMVGIGLYSLQDTLYIIRQLENRHEHELSQKKREWICITSGGHPGLVQALFSIFRNQPGAVAQMENIQWFATQEPVREEFRKLWEGLFEDERSGLREFARGNKSAMSQDTGKLLAAKGLLKPYGSEMILFTPLFEQWLLKL